jgi:hypothetical protein
MALISRFSRVTRSVGVPLGAKKPYHMSTSAPFYPLSPSVGTSGCCGRRSGLPAENAMSVRRGCGGGDMDQKEI